MICKATAADIDFLYGLYMAPTVNSFLLYEQMDLDEFKPVVKELLAKEVLYIFLYKQKAVGMFKLVPLTYRNSHVVYLGGLAIDPALSGKGLGEEMLREIISLAKEKGFKRIELSVATINERAIRLYEKVGFEKEGVLRNFTCLMKENKFLDEAVMSYLF